MDRLSKQKKIQFWALTLLFFILPVVFLFLKSVVLNFGFGHSSGIDFSLRGWEALFSESQLIQATLVSLGIGALVVFLNLGVGLLAGKALAFYSFKGKALIEALFLLPLIVPLLAIAMGIHVAMIRIGLSDTWIGVVLIHLVPTIPYSIKMLQSGYASIGTGILQQAQVLGTNRWHRFFSVELPLLMPSIRSTVFLIFVISLSQYVITAIIGGGNVVTLAMIYFPFLDSAESTVLAAFSAWFALLPILFYLSVELLLSLLPYQNPWRTRL
ncbi:ABC transporter permease subunit [Pontibacillus sp. ALD_SL1]|uniref:ABC transporter permease n=1 Tax=Pontibacillus sp. ALD_SL1 TaxID=2777185 RepID=UPI001A963D42|nr:ABC transporter permease subunit [Pontibacillus sp. ALD_SL1]QST00261.1 ABC transporter permease subunit [Pontibacillus sp. ALD_SL1]